MTDHRPGYPEGLSDTALIDELHKAAVLQERAYQRWQSQHPVLEGTERAHAERAHLDAARWTMRLMDIAVERLGALRFRLDRTSAALRDSTTIDRPYTAEDAVRSWARAQGPHQREVLARGTPYALWQAAVNAGVVSGLDMAEAKARHGDRWFYTGD